MLHESISAALRGFAEAVEAGPPALRPEQVGKVLRLGGGIAQITGLPDLKSEELVEFEGGVLGIATDLEADDVGVFLLGSGKGILAGSEVRATGREADTPVGETLLGRVLDATGRPLDGGRPLAGCERRAIERPAPAIIERLPVTVPLQTGIKIVDALVPIGRGQRELIIGDRQTGKTTVAVDAIINQRDKGIVCVYCAVGQRGTAVARVVDVLRRNHAMERTIVVVASDEDPPGLRFITPYAATAMAEHFMEAGKDVLIVYDDLTRHARAYRELSLLLRRPPGREAYPGDIFYVHSRLLERATHLVESLGGGSLTALPIVETQAQDISAYIPTNLISITDGQIYLSPTLFNRGVLPAIDVGNSVSRVGGKTQFPALREVAGELRLAYSQFEELETFSRFATRLDDETRTTIEHGRRVREILRQDEHSPMAVSRQIIVLKALDSGLLDDHPPERIRAAEEAIVDAAGSELPGLCERLEQGDALTDDEWQRVLEIAEAAAASSKED